MVENKDEIKADVGIVFVHGIGDHKEAETLLGFGEPMMDWMADWLRPRGGSMKITQARLKADRMESESPAYALAEICSGEQTTKCLMTEAWWGESVRPPDSLKLLGWLFYRGPLLVFSHFCIGRNEVVPVFLMRCIYAIPLCALVQILALVAMALWVIPIEFVRSRIAGAVRILTLTLGDSFVLLEQEFQRAAIVAHVRSTLAWAGERAENLILVAHSQGGAIAYEAIVGRSVLKLRQLITVGSGLEKLYLLRTVRSNRKPLLPAALAAPLVAPSLVTWWGTGFEEWVVGPAYVFAGALLLDLILLNLFLEDFRNELREELGEAKIEVPWLDVYATHDLVSAGPRSLLPPTVTRQKVVNLRSLLKDHTSYFDRFEDSLPAIWRSIVSATGRPAMLPTMDRLKFQHEWHTLALGVANWLLLTALFFSLYLYRAPLNPMGQPIEKLIRWFGLEKLNEVGGFLAAAFGQPASWLWAGIAAFAAYGLGWRFIQSVWELCAAARWRNLCRKKARQEWLSIDSVMPICVMGLSAIPLLLLLASHFDVLPRATWSAAGSGVFFVGLYLLTLLLAGTGPLRFEELALQAGKRQGLIQITNLYVFVFLCFRGAQFFWKVGSFSAVALPWLQACVLLVSASAWTGYCLRSGLRYSLIAAGAPWVAGVALLYLRIDFALLAMLLAAFVSQCGIILLHAVAKPKEA